VAQLIVRKLEKEVVQKLREQAAKYGISAEEQHRRILRASLVKKKRPSARRKKPATKMNFKEFLLTCPDFGDPDKLRQKDLPREINFD
jgi:plasmid stability protein